MQLEPSPPAPHPLRVAEISLQALRHNLAIARARTPTEAAAGSPTPPPRAIVVVKANAYGHGARIVAPAAIAAGATMVAVASLDEALALRAGGFDSPILCWLHGEDLDYAAAIRHRIELGLSTADQLRRLSAAAHRLGSTGRAQLKLDTGLSRNGASPEGWGELCAAAAAGQRAGTVHVSGVFSHLANAGPAADLTQAARFDAGVRALAAHGVRPDMHHLAASAAALASPHLHYDTVRIGMAAYGLRPDAHTSAGSSALRPVMTLASRIVALRTVPAGTGVSYGFTHVCERESTLALVPFGYADGMPRALNGSGATVSIGGARAPIVGRIGMDQCIIDVTALAPQPRVGDRVVLFGDPALGHPAVEEWATRLDTIAYEIVARIGERVQRVAVDTETQPPHLHTGEAPHRHRPDTRPTPPRLGFDL